MTPQDGVAPRHIGALTKISAAKKKLGMLEDGFTLYSATHSVPSILNSRHVENVDMGHAGLLKRNMNTNTSAGDITKSGYRLPINDQDELPTLTTGSLIFHWGRCQVVSGYVLMASQLCQPLPTMLLWASPWPPTHSNKFGFGARILHHMVDCTSSLVVLRLYYMLHTMHRDTVHQALHIIYYIAC